MDIKEYYNDLMARMEELFYHEIIDHSRRKIVTIQHNSTNDVPQAWYFRKRINPSVELLKPSLASKVPEAPYLWH